jgi:hypothetical protein
MLGGWVTTTVTGEVDDDVMIDDLRGGLGMVV